MCMISVKFSGDELPKEEHLIEASIKNKDGIGVCYWKFGKTEVYIKKDFKDVNDLIMWLKENITKDDVCVIHFRLATHGLVDEGNRHPFPITKNTELLRKTNLVCQMAVAHNGVLSQYAEHKKFSDTQKFVLDILSEETIKNNLENEKIRKLIDNFLGGDKLVILTHTGLVYLFGNWVKEGAILYSNKTYEKIVLEKNNFNYNRDVPYLGDCEGCGQSTACMWMKDLKIEQTEWFLCKACRKAYRKGRLKVEEFIVNSEEENSADKDILYGDLAKHYLLDETAQCESCLNWEYKKNLVDYYGAKLCKGCSNEYHTINYQN